MGKSKYVVVEFNKEKKPEDPRSVTVFGVFENEGKANAFVNARIRLLASEWDPTDGFLTQTLHWQVKSVNST